MLSWQLEPTKILGVRRIAMATPHVVGTDLKVTIDEKTGVTVNAELIDDLVETAKMKMLVSTSGFIPVGANLNGQPLYMNLQMGIKKPKS